MSVSIHASNTPNTTFSVVGQVHAGTAAGPVVATFSGSSLPAGEASFALASELVPGTYFLTATVTDAAGNARVLAGAAAAAFVLGDLASSAGKIPVKTGRNVRSVTPQAVMPDRPTVLYIRAAFPERDVILKAGLTEVKQRIVTPGETIRVTVLPEKLNPEAGVLPVSLEKGEKINA
jgi:hypothetical protein